MNAHIYKRTKHINIAYYYIRDLCRSNCIRVDFVSSNKIIINKLTKLLFKEKFKIFVKQLELQNSKNSKS